MTEPLLLAIDIGNSAVKCGLFSGDRLLAVRRLEHCPEIMETAGPGAKAEYGRGFGLLLEAAAIDKIPERCIICSVAPRRTGAVLEALGNMGCFEPFFFTHTLMNDFVIELKEPGKTGTDRLAAAWGAYALAGRPVAAVDMGTATTVNFVGEGPLFLGGAILPGPTLMRDSLSRGTEGLPAAGLEAEGGPPPAAGQETDEAIRAGILRGTAGAVEGIIEGAGAELGLEFDLVITGGHAPLVSHFIRKPHRLEPNLTLLGLKGAAARAFDISGGTSAKEEEGGVTD